MPLERVGGAAVDAALELHAAALLDDVRGLMCRGVQVGRAIEAHGVAERERACAERLRRITGRGPLVRRHARDVMAAEARLDLGEVRQRPASALDSARGDVGWRRSLGIAGGLALNRRRSRCELQGRNPSRPSRRQHRVGRIGWVRRCPVLGVHGSLRRRSRIFPRQRADNTVDRGLALNGYRAAGAGVVRRVARRLGRRRRYRRQHRGQRRLARYARRLRGDGLTCPGRASVAASIAVHRCPRVADPASN